MDVVPGGPPCSLGVDGAEGVGGQDLLVTGPHGRHGATLPLVGAAVAVLAPLLAGPSGLAAVATQAAQLPEADPAERGGGQDDGQPMEGGDGCVGEVHDGRQAGTPPHRGPEPADGAALMLGALPGDRGHPRPGLQHHGQGHGDRAGQAGHR